MSDLTDFLLARIAEDEERARKFHPDESLHVHFAADVEPTVLYTAARVLAECEAKRRIVEALSRPAPKPNGGIRGAIERDGVEWASTCAREGTLAALALPHADHPDYDTAWRP